MAPRALASPMTRQIFAGGLGFLATTGLAMTVDAVVDPAGADGTSPGRVDRAEARQILVGRSGVATFMAAGTALLVISQLYSRMRVHLSQREAGILKLIYPAAGGALIGSIVAPMLLRPVVPAGAPGERQIT